MNTIEATYRIVTPMFIGGAEGKPDDGIRPPSFKGALRFWWRALNWTKVYNIADLHKKEAELFGSAAKMNDGKQTGGQGVFLLSIKELGVSKPMNDWPKANTGAGYLAYGILESKGENGAYRFPIK
ncbi:MAG: type III-B CRISPR module RAMP protein Cmr1 [Ghiorsea sp.]|nr:type III-B CRISPR module RAMP protein Cmr1 [Ghiorsea sp.]